MIYKPRVKPFVKDIQNCITQEKLDLAKEYSGFDYYLPIGFLVDVMHFIGYKSYNKASNNIWNIEDKVSDFLLSIPAFIWMRLYKEYDILNKAMYILKYCGGVIDFKVLETNDFKFVEDKNDNFIHNLDVNTELPFFCRTINIGRNVEILNTLNKLFSKVPDTQIVKNRCIGYKKITKIKKSFLARPDFSYQLTKKISIFASQKNNPKDILIFIEDTSSSMSIGRSKEIADIIRFYLSGLTQEIHYFTKNFDDIKFIKLITAEDKLDFFSTTKFKRDYYDYKTILGSIKDLYHNQNIVIFTDGDDRMPDNIRLNNRLVVLNTGKLRQSIDSLCKINNGQQICL